ncbi:MAG: glycosyltransferase family 1 protein [Methanosarcinales archaeon]|nr:MAG: glycosyltransferase family 1 protein [Methanosarcinales archaeon]
MTTPKPALFISALEPGHTGGGALCTLAYIQALSQIHDNALTYIGPKFDENLYFPGTIKRKIFVPERSSLSKLITLIQAKSADRLSPFVERTVRSFKDEFEIVYINDERAGRFAAHPYFKGKKIIAIFHNYRADYQKTSDDRPNLLRRVANYINVKNSNLAYRFSDFRIFLTEYDRKRYREFMQIEHLDENSFGYGYFGTYDEDKNVIRKAESRKYVTINASLGRGHNVESILYFLNEIWQQVVTKNNKAQLIVAGRSPAQPIKDAIQHSRNAELIANPSFNEMEDIFSNTAVCLCTNMEGSGIKLRVAEALRRGIPAVCSWHCAIGYEDIDNRVLKIYSDPEECVSHLLYFLSTDNQNDITEKCLNEYESKLSFNAGVQKLTDVLKVNNII